MTRSPRIVHLDDVSAQPWRNGGGVTRELWAWPAADAWAARISVADIERDGPFSAYAGVQRWFAVLTGAGVELEFAGVPHVQRHADAPVVFDGAAAPGCRLLDGPTRDLNLMLRGVPGRMDSVRDAERWSPAAQACALFTAAAGELVHADASAPLALKPGSLVWFETAPPWLAFRSTAEAESVAGWWMAVGTQEQSQ